MVRKLQEKIGSWKYLPFPNNEVVIRGKLRKSSKDQWSPEIELVVDTGYFGSILLNYEVFQLLNYDQLTMPQKYWNEATTITGDVINMPSTPTKFKIANIQMDIVVESHELIQENLVGRDFLKRFLTLLDGEGKEISFWEKE